MCPNELSLKASPNYERNCNPDDECDCDPDDNQLNQSGLPISLTHSQFRAELISEVIASYQAQSQQPGFATNPSRVLSILGPTPIDQPSAANGHPLYKPPPPPSGALFRGQSYLHGLARLLQHRIAPRRLISGALCRSRSSEPPINRPISRPLVVVKSAGEISHHARSGTPYRGASSPSASWAGGSSPAHSPDTPRTIRGAGMPRSWATWACRQAHRVPSSPR